MSCFLLNRLTEKTYCSSDKVSSPSEKSSFPDFSSKTFVGLHNIGGKAWCNGSFCGVDLAISASNVTAGKRNPPKKLFFRGPAIRRKQTKTYGSIIHKDLGFQQVKRALEKVKVCSTLRGRSSQVV